ncbi:MAG: putative membrane protein insertion efficiency factor [Chlamydiae bacterium]|nr:putative membrane protein insertion efficiency factor [Chlamydiota bacterium]
MRKVLIFFIRFYQLALSPFVGKCCRFYPTCSDYACEAVDKHGFWKGGWLTLKRMVKCHPFHRGGYDPPP